MRGKLIKSDEHLAIKYINKQGNERLLPLHEDTINQIKKDSLVFDDIEARMLCYPDVEFKLINNKAKIIEK